MRGFFVACVSRPLSLLQKSEQKIHYLNFFGNGWIQGLCRIEGSETMDGTQGS
jgi:hypothetical protein